MKTKQDNPTDDIAKCCLKNGAESSGGCQETWVIVLRPENTAEKICRSRDRL